MSDHFEDMNPWAEKLQQATVPDSDSTWPAMLAALDKEMPVAKNNGWRKWLLLGILLLLLIGVCNMPIHEASQKKSISQHQLNGKTQPSNTSGTKTRNSEGVTDDSHPTKEISLNGKDGKNFDKEHAIQSNANGSSLNGTPGTSLRSKESFVNRDSYLKENGMNSKKPKDNIKIDNQESSDTQRVLKRAVSNKNKPIFAIRRIRGMKPHANRKKGKSKEENQDISFKREDQNERLQTGKDKRKISMAIIPVDSIQITCNDCIKSHQPTIATSVKRKTDSSASKAIKHPGKGIAWAAGLGLNQFFTVGSQEHGGYNSSGTSGGLSDYLPVPLLRVYLNRKLYVQLEAQFNAPQYTKQLLAKQALTVDTVANNLSGNPSLIAVQNSVYIKKLFYFNIPVSIHYSPFKNFYTGTGLQFSRLTNGVGLFEIQQFNTANANIAIQTNEKIASFKGNSVYEELKTHEFRFLFDANYQWKNVVLGARYNQALSKFIDLRISSTQITQARNSSLQLYLRYILWKNKTAKRLFAN